MIDGRLKLSPARQALYRCSGRRAIRVPDIKAGAINNEAVLMVDFISGNLIAKSCTVDWYEY